MGKKLRKFIKYTFSDRKSHQRTLLTVMLSAAVIIAVFITTCAAGTPSPAHSKLVLSHEEQKWVNEHPVIRIQMSRNFPPFEMQRGGRWQGMSYDYLIEAAARIGLQVEVTGIDWAEAVDKIQVPKDVDLLLTVMNRPERARIVHLTKPYLAFHQVIVTRKDAGFISGIKDLTKPVIVVEQAYVIATWLRRDFPEARVVEVEDSISALHKVSIGQADAYVGNLAVATHLIDQNGLVNLKISAPVEYGIEEFSMGVRKDWPELAHLLDRSLSTFTQEDHQKIRQKWLSIRYEHGIQRSDVVKWIMVSLLMAVAFILPLKFMVRNRTRELLEQKLLAEALLDNTFQFQGFLSPQGELVSINKTALEFIGVTKESVIGKYFWETPWWRHSTLEVERLKDAVSRCRKGELVRYEASHISKDGEAVIIDFSLKPLLGKSGVITYLIVEGRDITERKQAESMLKESQERFQTVFEESPLVMALNEVESGTFIDVNKKYCELLNIEKRDLLGRSAVELGFVSPEESDRLQGIMKTHGVIDNEEIITRNFNGDSRVSLLSTRNISVAGERYILSMLLDISERKQFEEQLVVSEEKFRNIFENAPIGIFQSIPAGRFVTVNAAFARTFGYDSPDDVLETVTDISSQIYADSQERQRFINRMAGLDTFVIDEVEFLHKDGTPFIANLFMRLIRDSTGKIIMFDGFVVDITERKQAEQNLIEREEQLRLYVERLPIACILWGTDYKVEKWNPAAERVFGYTEQEAKGKAANELIIPSEIKMSINSVWQRLMDGNQDSYNVNENITKDGRVILCEWTNTPFYARDGSISGVISMAQDITERHRVESSLRASEKRLRSIAQSVSDLIWVINGNLKFTFLSPSLERIHGWLPEELMGREISCLLTPLSQQKVFAFINKELTWQKEHGEPSGKIANLELEMLRKDGSYFWSEVCAICIETDDGTSFNIVGTTRDITERKSNEQLMIQNEKMSTISGLAAGMAHEINNPLGVIVQNLQNIERRLLNSNEINRETAEAIGIDLNMLREYLHRREIFEFIASSRRGCERATKIISNMLAFSRKGGAGQLPADIHQIIEKSIEMAQSDYDLKKKYDFRNIIITKKFTPCLPPVMVNETEIEQVLINLLKNSAHALAEQSGGLTPEIEIRTYLENGYLIIKISDNGTGIPYDIQQKIFDPFFTTKDVGAGTGLGLYVSYAIVTNNHKGLLTVDSTPGNGAAFTIKLPVGDIS